MKVITFRKLSLVLALVLIFLENVQPSFAGPPFITDDPPPIQYQQWQIYLFNTSNHNSSATTLNLPALEFDYGLLPQLEVDLITPIATNLPTKRAEPRATGLGDMQFTTKYRFIQETSNHPQVSFAPSLFIPTGDANRNLGNGRAWVSLPFWVQKSWNNWTCYGGGGYAMNSKKDMTNFFFEGVVLQKQITEKFALGGELFSQGKSSNDVHAFTLMNFGFIVNLTPEFAVLGSIGSSILGQSNISSYLGLNWTS